MSEIYEDLDPDSTDESVVAFVPGDAGTEAAAQDALKAEFNLPFSPTLSFGSEERPSLMDRLRGFFERLAMRNL